MSGIDFGSFGDEEPTPIKDPEKPARKSKPKTPPKPKTNWKTKHQALEKKYWSLQKENDELTERITESNSEHQDMFNLSNKEKEQIIILKEQDRMSKMAINSLTTQLEQFKFSPQSYSKLVQVLGALHVNAHKNQQAILDDIVGSHSIMEVRKWIFALLEAPYK